jgi:hypothetical protein
MREPSRRAFLAAAGASGLVASAGCLGFLETRPAGREPPLPEDRPDAPYYPTHTEGMQMVGTSTSGRFSCALSFTWPHRFWLVRGSDTDRVNAKGADDLHLMASVWDAEAGVSVPAASPQIEYTDPDGVSETFTPWQMLSQRMGVHYGDNVTLGPEGVYDVTVRVPPPGTRTTTEAGDGSTLEFDFEMTYERSALESLSYEDIPSDREGSEGAVDPMGMKAVQVGQTPAGDSFPVSVLGTGETGGAALVVATADERGSLATGEDETFLLASLRTPHNRFVIPAASLSATVDAGGETVFDGRLVPTLDPEVGYHYGAVVSTGSSLDGATVSVDTPPQVARHEGYETAFFEFEDVTV